MRQSKAGQQPQRQQQPWCTSGTTLTDCCCVRMSRGKSEVLDISIVCTLMLCVCSHGVYGYSVRNICMSKLKPMCARVGNTVVRKFIAHCRAQRICESNYTLRRCFASSSARRAIIMRERVCSVLLLLLPQCLPLRFAHTADDATSERNSHNAATDSTRIWLSLAIRTLYTVHTCAQFVFVLLMGALNSPNHHHTPHGGCKICNTMRLQHVHLVSCRDDRSRANRKRNR